MRTEYKKQLTVKKLIQHLILFEDLDMEIWVYGYDKDGKKKKDYFTKECIEISPFHYLCGEVSDVVKIRINLEESVDDEN